MTTDLVILHVYYHDMYYELSVVIGPCKILCRLRGIPIDKLDGGNGQISPLGFVPGARMMEMVVTCEAVRHAKLWSNCHQHINV